MVAALSPSASSAVFFRYRPFFDLGPALDGPLSAQGPILGYEALENEHALSTQHSYGELFRASLLRESGAAVYGFSSPAQVPLESRTPEWTRLCELVEQFPALPLRSQSRVCRLLILLCFHRLVLRLVPADLHPDPGDAEVCTLAFARMFAEYTLRSDHGDRSEPTGLRSLLDAAPSGAKVRTAIAMLLLNDAAKVRRSAQLTACYRAETEAELGVEMLRSDDFDNHTDALLVSRFYRGASFLPFLNGEREKVVAEMDRAERAARIALGLARTPTERVLAQESLFFVTESRMREAQWLGDRDLWLERAENLIVLDPGDAKAWIEVGEARHAAGDVEGATAAYVMASRLGPPGTAVALFLAGACREQLGDVDGACDAYYRAVTNDASATTATESLLRTARLTGQRSLAAWAELRLGELRRPAARVPVGRG